MPLSGLFTAIQGRQDADDNDYRRRNKAVQRRLIECESWPQSFVLLGFNSLTNY